MVLPPSQMRHERPLSNKQPPETGEDATLKATANSIRLGAVGILTFHRLDSANAPFASAT